MLTRTSTFLMKLCNLEANVLLLWQQLPLSGDPGGTAVYIR